jgi:hypothetical protein
MKNLPNNERRGEIIREMVSILETERPWIELYHGTSHAIPSGARAPSSCGDAGAFRLSGVLAKELPLIRWSAQSHIGAEIERQLRRMRVEIPRRFEFDSGSTILSMVAAGIGWR